jgi:pimeloyl-ACP methyl ester carboxylesterase
MARRFLLGLVALVLLALVVNDVLARRETRPAQASGGQLIGVAGQDLKVREDGPRAGPPVVLLHGFGASSRWWDRAVPALARRHRVVAFDLLGHGGSAAPTDGYSMENQARLVAAGMRQLGVRNAIVAGHSMGGNVAVALAEGNPGLVRGIVVVGTRSGVQDGGDLGLTARLGFYPLIGPALNRLATEGQVRKIVEQVAMAPGAPVPDAFVDDVRGLTYSAYNESGSSADDYVDAQPLARRMQVLRRPVLVLFGSRDATAKPGAWNAYRTVPQATIRVIPGSGHSPMWENPALTNRHLLAFARPS